MSQLPYQRLALCGNTLIAARGSEIDTFDLSQVGGPYLSTWKCPSKKGSDSLEKLKQEEIVVKMEPVVVEKSEESGPVAKRRKLSNGDSAESEDIKAQETKPQNGKAKKKPSKPSQGNDTPNVVVLACTSGLENQHVVAVTGEDKTIRVFKLTKAGVLEQLSERVMPKRPCALSITADASTIICGDKFGDVYSLPLIPSPKEAEPESTTQDSEVKNPATEEVQEKSAPYVPAANHLTIHTQRNIKALENQKRHIPKTKSKEPGPAKFEHNLLLGHVSMLTDLCLTKIEGRNYILTSDRDEHIRISRGIPQAHVIEGYCLGHKEFISRICKPKTYNTENLLISGGGDDEIFAWDLPTGKLVTKCDLRSHVESVMSKEMKVAVTGIYHLSCAEDLYGQSFGVICEGVPALFIFFFTASVPEPDEEPGLFTPPGTPNTLTHLQTIPLKGNPLSLVSCYWNCSVIISIDNYFKSGSTTEVRAPDEKVDSLQKLMASARNVWAELDTSVELEKVVGQECEVKLGKEELQGLLYGVGNLRKMGKEEDDGDGE